MHFLKVIRLLLLYVMVLSLSGCLGGSSNKNNIDNDVFTMTFIDAPVVNLDYQCGKKTAKTDQNGTLTCPELPVTFSVGGFKIGEVISLPLDGRVFPQDLLNVKRDNTSDEGVKLIASLLQSLDIDKTTENIVLLETDLTKLELVGLTEESLKDVLGEKGIEVIPPDVAAAKLRENVAAVNVAPSSSAQEISLKANKSTTVKLQGDDHEKDDLVFQIITAPLHGSLSGEAPNLTYTPDENYIGEDSFTYKVSDSFSDSNISKITIRIENNAPSAVDQTVSVKQNSVSNSIALSGNDKDGDLYSYEVKSQPNNGALSGTAPNLNYKPNNGFFGSDSFTFVVNDGIEDSVVATVTINVEKVVVIKNTPPTANDQSISVERNSTANSITLAGYDKDGDAISYKVKSQPTNGTLTGSAPNLSYTPNKDFSGSDSFTFLVNDGKLDSNIARITIKMKNNAPEAIDQSVTVEKNSTTNTITLAGNDKDGDTLTYEIVAQPLYGTLSGTAPNLNYRPDNFYAGPDSFSFLVNDGSINSTIATVNIDVDEPLKCHESLDISVVVDKNSQDNLITMLAIHQDVIPGILGFAIHKAPKKGTVYPRIGNPVNYTPRPGETGEDSYGFFINDGSIPTVPIPSRYCPNTIPLGKVTIYINSPPTTASQDITVNENSFENEIVLEGADVDQDKGYHKGLTFTLKDLPKHGEIIGDAPNLVYKPEANYSGNDEFTYVVNDGRMDSEVGTIKIVVNAIPVATEQTISVEENAQDFEITLAGTDKDSNDGELTFEIVEHPLHGVVTLDGNIVTYTPTTDYLGDDSFTFKASDTTTSSEPSNINIEVVEVPVVRKTGQKFSYNIDGQKVGGEGIGAGSVKDDGYYQKGRAHNYTIDADQGVLVDNNTGLMWQDNLATGWTKAQIDNIENVDLQPIVKKTWLSSENYSACSRKEDDMPECFDTSGDTAQKYCENLTLAGKSDWRLPTVGELELMINYSFGYDTSETLDYRPVFQYLNIWGESQVYYWTSSTQFVASSYNLNAWGVWSANGDVKSLPKDGEYNVRCVRKVN